MSKELDKTKEYIMSRINSGEIKMRPRSYFILGYFIAIIGLVFSFITSVFFVGLTRFMFRSHGPMGGYRIGQLLSSFSWWIPSVAILGLALGIWLIRKYDFSYKINFKLLIAGIISFIILSGFVIDIIGLNEFWLKRNQGRGQGQRQGQVDFDKIKLRQPNFKPN